MNNQKNAEELLEVLMNSKSHNPAWALQDVLDKLRNQLSGQNPVDWKDECNVMYVLGYDDCLKDISAICKEKRVLTGKKSAKKVNSQRWECCETGYVSTAAGIVVYQRARGIDTSKNNRRKIS